MDNIIEITVPISVGELFDKITILKIKKEKISCIDKKNNILKELDLLQQKSLVINQNKIFDLINSLEKINRVLWDIEEKKRHKEKEKTFDDEFVQLAREVYINNDKRAEIKKQINFITNSLIVEEKSYG